MEVVLDAERRDQFGRNNAGRLRRAGRIPAVLYGTGDTRGESISVDPKALSKILHGPGGVNALISLTLAGGAATKVVVKEYQIDPVEHDLLHVDFYRVAMDKPIRVTVSVRLVGEARGVKQQGGLVDFVHRELHVECLPGDIPDEVVIDVSEMMVHDAVRVRDLDTGGKWKPVSDAEMLIVHVVAPRAEAAATDEAAAAPGAAEPELIKKGKGEKAEDEKA